MVHHSSLCSFTLSLCLFAVVHHHTRTILNGFIQMNRQKCMYIKAACYAHHCHAICYAWSCANWRDKKLRAEKTSHTTQQLQQATKTKQYPHKNEH